MTSKRSALADEDARPERRNEVRSTDAVRMYLKEIGRTPLLTAAQEMDLGRRIDAGAGATRLLASMHSTGRMDPKEFRGLVGRTYRARSRAAEIGHLRRVERQGRTAQTQLIVANLRLVVSIAKRYVGRGMLFLDLVQEGNLGLIRATKTFDPSKGFKFSTYATWWIRQGVTRGIADQGRTIRVPVAMTELVNTVWRVQRELVQDLGREPVPGEIGLQMGVAGGTVREIRKLSAMPISLETRLVEGEDARLGEVIADRTTVAPAKAAAAAMLKKDLDSVLGTLSARERRIIQLRFGLTDDRPLTLAEIGQEFRLTRERIRQIEAKALSKLRHPSSATKLRDFLE